MELSRAAAEGTRQKLQQVRNTVLTLHKAVLDSERTSYEMVYGSVSSPAAFLQLLINDPWFAWLQPMTNLIVQIDEALAAKPPKPPRDLERLLEDTRALLSPSRAESEFWKRYSSTILRDPGVSVLHEQLQREFAG